MDKGYEKERFESLSIKTSVAKQFRKYCKAISKSQSMTLYHMVNFFELNNVSPQDNLKETISAIKGQIIKRSNAVIAIIKNIEKMHHKPTTAILQSLFEETSNLDKKEEDSFDFGAPKLITEDEELKYYQEAYYAAQADNNSLKQEVAALISNIKYVRNNFGLGYYRLNITKEDLELFKQKLDDVHQHNTPKTRG